MRDFSPWLGLCHIRQEAEGTPNDQPTFVAVWADSRETFEREIHSHLASKSMQMIWAEGVLPAEEWLAKHPGRKDAQRLAAKVSKKYPVEIGAFGAGATGMVTDGQPEGEAEGYLHIEEIKGVEPLDAQFGVHPPKNVPDVLAGPLFGQPEPSKAEVAHYGDKPVPPLNTYAILDAAKVVNFVEMLQASGLEYRCLFKGKAAQEMRDVAPYVVRLEEGNDFTRNLFSKDPEADMPWFMWDSEPGIYVRSRGSLEDMWGHFRKFTKVQDEEGKWFYFRFWEPKVLSILIAQKSSDYTIASSLLDTRSAHMPLTVFISKPVSFQVTKVISKAEKPEPTTPLHPILTRQDFALLKGEKLQRDIDDIDMKIANKLSNYISHLSPKDRRIIIQNTVKKFMTLGFKQKKYLLQFCVWSLLIGQEFETSDPEGTLGRICYGPQDEHRRFETFSIRVKELQMAQS